MEELEYTKIPVRLIPYEIKVEYKVSKFEYAGYVYVQINKGMYGLAQEGLLANELLAKWWQNTDSVKHHTPQAYGNTTQSPSNSH